MRNYLDFIIIVLFTFLLGLVLGTAFAPAFYEGAVDCPSNKQEKVTYGRQTHKRNAARHVHPAVRRVHSYRFHTDEKQLHVQMHPPCPYSSTMDHIAPGRPWYDP